MDKYWDGFVGAYSGYFNYLWNEITNPSWHNYFYWLFLVSAFFFVLEWLIPWRKEQALFRRDFWMDFFYMYFNFFLFSLIIYNAASFVVVELFNDAIRGITGLDLQQMNPMRTWPMWAILLVGFFVRDFVQWNVHRLLHKHPRLWEFHKVHHSVQEMGFAAHLRYHWMETVVYRSIEYIPLALLGIGLYDFFIIHIFTLAVGHYNHSNISISGQTTGGFLGGLLGICFGYGLADLPHLTMPVLGPYGVVCAGILAGVVILGPIMKLVFNSPEMHIWHHAEHLPDEKKYGVNYGLTLAMWDYIFNTAYIPRSGRDIKLGFKGVQSFPQRFLDQVKYGFKDTKNSE